MPTSALPKITALMGAYNYGRYIGEAITSAMEQEYPPELLDLVIVDDGSTDDTPTVVAQLIRSAIRGVSPLSSSGTPGQPPATNRAPG